jgi:hypothetical protein
MSQYAPTLPDCWLVRVQRAVVSRDRRVWECKMVCGHTIRHNYRKSRPWPRELRCAECAGVKGGAS